MATDANGTGSAPRTTGRHRATATHAAVGNVAGLAAAVGLVFAGGWAVGSSTGATAPVVPVVPVVPAAPAGPAVPVSPVARSADPEAAVLGLASTRAGYTLRPVTTVLPWQEWTEVAFTITGSDGVPVRAFDGGPAAVDVAVIRRDDAGYETLRAVQGSDGVWRAPMRFPGAGVWRLYAAFTPAGGPALDLGADLFVPGPFGPFTFSSEQRSVDSGPFTVRLDGELLPGGSSRVFVTVSRNGLPVTALEPVAGTGAFGRLVAVRQGDLARVPLRPEITGADPAARSGPGVVFTAEVPSTGSYRVFLTFTHGGVERTAEFTVDTAAGGG